MNRTQVLEQISRAIGTRELVWFGTRGDDAACVADLEQLSTVISVIGQFDQRLDVRSLSLEGLTAHRVDLDAHDIDEDPHPAVGELRAQLLKVLSGPSVAFTYRPSTLLSAACFARRGSTTYLGMFKDHQSAFEHKPWVETAVADLGLPRVPWKYIADDDRAQVVPMLDKGPVVVRRSRSSGGVGITRVDSVAELDGAWPDQLDSFASVSEYIDGTVPINVGGVVWDNAVTVHLPSVQLIGQPELTSRVFGYCGNDFGAAKALPGGVIDALETSMTEIGTWMGTLGYRGAFGVDFLLQDEVPLFLEVNPRFQGSTRASSGISREAGESCIVTDHIAALLHLRPDPVAPLAERTAAAPDLAQLVHHWQGTTPDAVDGFRLAREIAAVPGFLRADVVAAPYRRCDPGATVGRFTVARSVTTTGFDLDQDITDAIGRAGTLISDTGEQP